MPGLSSVNPNFPCTRGGGTPPLPLPGAWARKVVGGLLKVLPPRRDETARDIPHFSHLAAILRYLVAHLAHLEPSYAHLSLS